MKKYLDLQINVLKLDSKDVLVRSDAELPLMPTDADSGTEEA